jgi:ribonuclease HII
MLEDSAVERIQPGVGNLLVAGVDEAGRGPLAGPVAAAAVILAPGDDGVGLCDSKLLSPARRAVLEAEIRQRALAWAVAFASVEEIDRLNILRATLLAMQRSVGALGVMPDHALVDGNHCPELACTAGAVVRGDAIVPAISAASILAKEARDREMAQLDLVYPGYGFSRHKGYGTRDHLAALYALGPSAAHRRSFRPVREAERGGPDSTRSEQIG